MGKKNTGGRTLLAGAALLLGCPLLISSANAAVHKKSEPKAQHVRANMVAVQHSKLRGLAAASHGRGSFANGRGMTRQAGISCVPYARMVSGVEIPGNAWEWWGNAAGIYARGTHPEAGGILAFRSNPHMRLGHVAVVREVINAREVMIDHANWASGGMKGAVSRNIAVVDVSEANDWSAVRVELGRSGTFGSVYPAYGFIYARPDRGVMEAALTQPAPQPELNPPPRDLRPVAERPWRTYEEVAEAPARSSRRR